MTYLLFQVEIQVETLFFLRALPGTTWDCRDMIGRWLSLVYYFSTPSHILTAIWAEEKEIQLE
jgi:hypothetical protein